MQMCVKYAMSKGKGKYEKETNDLLLRMLEQQSKWLETYYWGPISILPIGQFPPRCR